MVQGRGPFIEEIVGEMKRWFDAADGFTLYKSILDHRYGHGIFLRDFRFVSELFNESCLNVGFQAPILVLVQCPYHSNQFQVYIFASDFDGRSFPDNWTTQTSQWQPCWRVSVV
jgi:hypothetical protein